MSILTYAFYHNKKRNISNEIMKKLKYTDFFSIDCSTNTIGLKNTTELLSHIKKSNYKYIVGLGIYSGKNNVLKVEKRAKNQFRNEKIIKDAPEYYDIGEFINVESLKGNFVLSEKNG